MLGLEHAGLAASFWDSMDRRSRWRSDIPEEPEARRHAVEAFAELEAFRRRHGATSFVNLSDAEGRREARAADLDKLRQLREEYSWE